MSDETNTPAAQTTPVTDDAVVLARFEHMMRSDPELAAFLSPLLKDADSDGDGKVDAAGIKGLRALFYKDGQFSKTATFAVLGNGLVLGNYALLSWFAGATVALGWLSFTVPAFDVGAAAAILGMLNGSYLGNNFLKNQAARQSGATTA